MSTITLPNIRVSSDLTVSVRLKDNGVAIDWSTLNNVKASIYSDAQRALAGRCDVSVDAEDPTVLVCQYAANKPQYVGVCRIVVSAKYMGETKTYDKPAFNFVRWTADQDGEQITIDDPDVDVEIEVSDVSSSLLDEAIRAAFTAAEEAVDAKGQVLETEAEVEAAEALRVSAEESRVEAEEGRAEAEAARVDEEAVRVSAEDARVVAENARAAAEDLREGAEDDRAAAETARETAEAARVAAEALRVTAEGSRETAEAAREAQASADHTVAAGDHTQAAADHTQAAADHTTAASDHTQAGADHTLAAADHVTAGEDHAQAQDDHEVMEGYDTRLGSVESEVSQLEAKVGEEINFGIVTDADFIDGYRINGNTGADQVDATRAISPYLPVSPGTVVTFSGNKPNNDVLWAIYNADKEMVDNSGTITGLTAIREDYTMPSNAAFIRFVRLINNGTHCTIVCDTKNIRYDVDSINQQIFGNLFLFRNGSVGNSGNAQYIFSSYIFPFKNYKKVSVYTNRPPAEGNEYRFCFQTYSREVGIPSSEHALNAYVRNVTVYSTVNQSVTPNTGELGVGFGIGEFVKGTNTVVPIRVDDFANYDLFIYGITAEDEILKADILAQTNAAISVVDAKVMQNTDSIQTITDAISSPEDKELTLTGGQAWNAKADTAVGATISRTNDTAFKSADAIAVEKGMTFRIGVRRYKNYYYAIFTDADNKFVAGDVLGGSLDSGLTYHDIVVPEGATRLLINSYSSSPVAVWTNSFDAIKNAIKPTIISLNKDMEVAVNAASNYRYKPNNQNKMMSLLVSTDVHGDATRFARAMEYLDAMPSVDMGICLGDMNPASFAESIDWYVDSVNGGQKPYLTVIGNHDAGNSASVSLAGTMQQIFDKFILPVRDKIGIPTLDKSYYSIQNDTYKVTVIVLDVYDLPDTMVDENNFAVSRTTWGMSQAQVNWLLSTLASVPSNYTVLLAYHFAGDLNTKYVCDWSQKIGFNYINPAGTYVGMLGDIINAWKNGASINKSFAPSQLQDYMPTLSVSADFSSRGVGLFAAHLTGHIHRDYIGHLTEHPDQLVIGLAQTANDNNQNFSDLDRAIGTKAEDAITVLGINTINKTVNLVRIGANVTNDMVNRSFIALPY